MATALDPQLFLPEPAPHGVRYTIISVDDHVVAPPHTYEGRLPAALQSRAPRIVETAQGHRVVVIFERALENEGLLEC